METGVLGSIALIIGAVFGTGGVTALVLAIVKWKEAKNVSISNRDNFEKERTEMFTEMQKYLNDEMKKMNDNIKKQMIDLQNENNELKKEMKELNKQLAELIQWVMSDNAAYRSWLENALRELKPDIVMPTCSDPPIVFGVNEEDIKD